MEDRCVCIWNIIESGKIVVIWSIFLNDDLFNNVSNQVQE